MPRVHLVNVYKKKNQERTETQIDNFRFARVSQ